MKLLWVGSISEFLEVGIQIPNLNKNEFLLFEIYLNELLPYLADLLENHWLLFLYHFFIETYLLLHVGFDLFLLLLSKFYIVLNDLLHLFHY